MLTEEKKAESTGYDPVTGEAKFHVQTAKKRGIGPINLLSTCPICGHDGHTAYCQSCGTPQTTEDTTDTNGHGFVGRMKGFFNKSKNEERG